MTFVEAVREAMNGALIRRQTWVPWLVLRWNWDRSAWEVCSSPRASDWSREGMMLLSPLQVVAADWEARRD